MSTGIESLRFGTVGLLSNVVLYFLYLAITALGIGHKSAMTALYCLGFLQTFMLNKKWTFRHEGMLRKTLMRYWVVYVSGYLLNLILLIVFVDLAGFPHQAVQAAMIVLIAALTFVLQKLWVFRTTIP